MLKMVLKLLEKKKDEEDLGWPKELLADDNHQNHARLFYLAVRIHANTKAKVLLIVTTAVHFCEQPVSPHQL